MKTVFLFLKNPLFISDLLRTRYIEYLASKYRVVVFHNLIQNESDAQHRYFTSPNIIYIPWQVQNKWIFLIFKFLRTNCLHELDDFPSMRIYYSSAMFLNDRRARLARFLSRPFARWLTIDFFTRVEKFFTRNTRIFNEYCKRYRPAAVIVATPGLQVYDAEAIILAQKRGIPTLATNFSWDNLVGFKAARLRRPDFLLVWNEVIREAALTVHRFKPERVLVTGSMRFDRYFDSSYTLPSREEFLVLKNLDPALPTILFATVGTPYEPLLLKKIIEWRDRGEIPAINVLVRVHPFDKPERYCDISTVEQVCVDIADKVIDARQNNKEIVLDRDGFINLKSTLAYTDININYKSTISLESFIFDKPVINFVNPSRPMHNQIYYDKHSYYYPVVARSAARVTRDEEELKNAINEYLTHPQHDREARQDARRMFFAFSDGLSYKRNVDFLEKIIEND